MVGAEAILLHVPGTDSVQRKDAKVMYLRCTSPLCLAHMSRRDLLQDLVVLIEDIRIRIV